MKKRILSLALIIMSSIGIFAQSTHHCRAQEENAAFYKKNPKALKEHQQFETFTKNYAKNNSNNKAGESYTVPVVFHIYGDVQSGKTVTYNKIATALNVLNDDFNGLNSDYNTVEPFFQARRSTMNIQFKLAKIDPNGGSTSGVIFHPTRNGYGNGGGYDNQIAADAWDNKKYMNVYIQNDLYNDGSLTNSGVAWYPDISMTNSNLARVVFNGAYLYGNGDSEFSSTLTHEFGHFLNLIHTFEGGCTGTDQVADTPNEDGNHALSCTPGTNCSGGKVNIENYMGYNGARGCYKMFTQGQVARMLAALQHPARITLWQPQNLIDTGVNATGSSIVSSKSILKEAIANNGTFTDNSTISIIGTKTFAVTSGTMTAGVHYTHTFPAGITPVLTANGNNTITLTLSGQSNNHTTANNATGGITFLAAAFSGGTSGIIASNLNFNFEFYDPYGIFYVNMADVTASDAATWTYFTINKGDDPAFGTWRYAANHYKLETYGKKLVCEANSRNISALNAGAVISQGNNFTPPGAYPNQLDVRTPSYTNWDGKTAYIGFEYTIDGNPCYGWFKVIATSNGSGYTVTEYAYNTQPFGTITAGSTSNGTTVVAPTNLTATANNTSLQVVLSWTDNANNETGYTVERATGTGTYAVIANLATNANAYTNTGLATGNTYSYRVRASANAVNSDYSNVATASLTNIPSGYCTAQGNNQYEHIKTVSIGSFTNTSGADASGYGNYTSQTITLTPNATATINLTPGFSGSAYTESWSVWIDYNKNNIFDPSELVVSNLSSNGAVSKSFAVPSNATGTTRMRVAMKYYSAATSACGNLGDGEVEDYTVDFSGNQQNTLATPINIGNSGIYGTGFYASWTQVSAATNYEVQLFQSNAWTTVGTSNTYYLWIPKQGTTTNYRFRVRATNATSTSNWSNFVDIVLTGTAKITKETGKPSITMYPNPAVDMVYFNTNQEDTKNTTITIYDSFGKLIATIKNQNSYSVQKLTRGLYFVKIVTETFEETKTLSVK
ncbi:M43 family zinc metalloprotease [Flavobacterium sp.]|uniref:M43 family zinc metalloprotease n=1 Tax=Flavobacterium sp. TaxID=239 RepID=UPI004047B74C